MRFLRPGVIVVPALFIWNCGSSTSAVVLDGTTFTGTTKPVANQL